MLATVLGHPSTTRETLPRALRVYDEIRRPAAHAASAATRLNGRYFSFTAEGLDFDRYSGPQQWDQLQKLFGKIVKNWEWSAFSSAGNARQSDFVYSSLDDIYRQGYSGCATDVDDVSGRMAWGPIFFSIGQLYNVSDEIAFSACSS
jgi:hypothetical protein